MSAEIFGVWVAVSLTLFIFSFLYKDNPLYKIAEHMYVGVSVGYSIVIVVDTVFIKKIYGPIVNEHKIWLIIPVILGCFIVCRLIPSLVWVSRWAFAFIIGISSGMAIPRIIAYMFRQVGAAITPFNFSLKSFSFFKWESYAFLTQFVVLIGTLTVLFYFFFSISHDGKKRYISKTGIYFLMISFGSAFGYTVMARISLLIGRVIDLKRFAGKQYYYATYILLPIVIILLIMMDLSEKNKGNSKERV